MVACSAKPLAVSWGEASIGGCVVRKKATLKTTVANWTATKRMPLARATRSQRNVPPSPFSVRSLRIKPEVISYLLSPNQTTPAQSCRPLSGARRRAGSGCETLEEERKDVHDWAPCREGWPCSTIGSFTCGCSTFSGCLLVEAH